ncbi:MAG: Rrf2 family transcriptional regulator [Planctomycetaceae bacterium]|nr:Rrf2 family transcriptional regulator [Planctomycetaceae bacterium]
MKLSMAAELALRGMVMLAQKHGNGPITLECICQERELPKQYLTKIFASLAKADIVTPIRGKNGGYRLSREPSEISLRQIIEVIEGPIAVNFCQQQPSKCKSECSMKPVWTNIQQVLVEKLSSTSLADLLAPVTQTS